MSERPTVCKCKPSKCKVTMNKVAYSGHVIGNGSITPMYDKIQAVWEFSCTVTKRNARVFLGLTGYYMLLIMAS